MTEQRARGVRGLVASFRGMMMVAVASVSLAACDAGTPPKNELRFKTDEFVIRVSPEQRPTRALEPTYWRVVVNDIKTGAPIQGGEGRIFATNRDSKTVANGLSETGELGTYRTNLMFVTAGMWAMGLQFRRDSTKALQRTEDWTQDIMMADEPGDFTTPQSTRAPQDQRETVLPEKSAPSGAKPAPAPKKEP
jgi:hypothetical protein